MNSLSAVGFFVLGILLFILPQLAPTLCPVSSYDGSSARALWLGLMGLVNGGIGAGRLCAGAWGRIRPWLEYPTNHNVALHRRVSRTARSGI